ncbi:MAG: hypothetical protein JWO68_190, partial [Actinomycetia bacterium]|nr:hypothetical protein [Actinomycetes bacterium]
LGQLLDRGAGLVGAHQLVFETQEEAAGRHTP